jgi:hypothetical protein
MKSPLHFDPASCRNSIGGINLEHSTHSMPHAPVYLDDTEYEEEGEHEEEEEEEEGPIEFKYDEWANSYNYSEVKYEGKTDSTNRYYGVEMTNYPWKIDESVVHRQIVKIYVPIPEGEYSPSMKKFLGAVERCVNEKLTEYQLSTLLSVGIRLIDHQSIYHHFIYHHFINHSATQTNTKPRYFLSRESRLIQHVKGIDQDRRSLPPRVGFRRFCRWHFRE